MNAKNQGRRVLVVAAGLGFLLLVGLLAPPSAITLTVSSKVKVTGISAITPLKRVPVPQTVTVIAQDFENGLAWTPSPSPCALCPSWGLLNAFQCFNQVNTKVASFGKPSTCGWTTPAPYVNQTLSSPIVTPPVAPTWSTNSAYTVSLDARKMVNPSQVTTLLMITDGFGSNLVTMFPDATGNLVHIDTTVTNSAAYLAAATNQFKVNVVNPTTGSGAEFDIDNFHAKVVFSAATPCNQFVIQIMESESSLNTSGSAALIFNPTATPRMLVYTPMGYPFTDPPPTFPANTVLGSNFSSTCQALNPLDPNAYQYQIPAGEASAFIELPPSWTATGPCIVWAMLYDAFTGELSPVTAIPVAKGN